MLRVTSLRLANSVFRKFPKNTVLLIKRNNSSNTLNLNNSTQSKFGYRDEPIKMVTAKEEADKLSNLGPEEYAAALLAMPTESALNILNHTSPLSLSSLSSLSYLQRIQDPKTPLVSLKKMIEAIETYELNYLKKISEKTPFVETNSSPLIDVWANYDTFILQNVSEEEEKIGKIYFGEKPQRIPTSPNIHSVASEEVFKKNFAIFTERQFEGWQEWDNMVVVGGSIVASLLPVPTDNVAEFYHEIAYPTSDIDVYFYGLTSTEMANKIGRLYEHLKKVNGEDIIVVRTQYTITFCSAWPKRHIQIVIGSWDSIPGIIFEADIDCTSVAYDGKNIYATERSRFSFNHRAIITSGRGYSCRPFPEYEKRLVKYSQRGFYISLRYLLSGEQCDLKRIFMALDYCSLVIFMESCGINFFANKTERRFKDEGLPYGPVWNTEMIKEHLKKPVFEDSPYGAYETVSAFECISDTQIQDWQAVMETLDMNKTDDLCNLSFHDNIFLDQDKQEITKEKKCSWCFQPDAKFMTSLYPSITSYCKKCSEDEISTTKGIIVDEKYRRNIEEIIPPSAKLLYSERFSNKDSNFDEPNPTVHITTSLSDEIVVEDS